MAVNNSRYPPTIKDINKLMFARKHDGWDLVMNQHVTQPLPNVKVPCEDSIEKQSVSNF